MTPEWLQRVADETPVPIFVIRQERHILWTNKAGRALLRDDSPEKPCYARLFSLDHPCPDCQMKEALAIGKSLCARIHVPQETRTVVFAQQITCLSNSEAVITLIDVTDWEEAEVECKRALDRLRHLAETAEGFTRTLTVRDVLHYIIPSIRSDLGFDECATFAIDMGKPTWVVLQTDWPERTEAFRRQVLEAGEQLGVPKIQSSSYEHGAVSCSLPSRPGGILSHLILPFEVNGEAEGIIGIGSVDPDAYDPNHVRLLKTAVHAAAIAIRRSLLFEEVIQAERFAAVGQTIAGLGHSLKNLVAAGSVAKEAIDKALREERFDSVQRTWPVLKRNFEKIAQTVVDMLDYTWIEGVHVEPVLIREWVREVLVPIQARAEMANVRVTIEMDETLDVVYFDPTKTQTCLSNICANAVEAMEDGGELYLCVAREKGAEGKEWLVFVVRDTGPGIHPEIRDRIFDRFFTTKTEEKAGTGLGLYLAKRMIENQGGTISVESDLGKGTTFTVRLPWIEENDAPIVVPEED